MPQKQIISSHDDRLPVYASRVQKATLRVNPGLCFPPAPSPPLIRKHGRAALEALGGRLRAPTLEIRCLSRGGRPWQSLSSSSPSASSAERGRLTEDCLHTGSWSRRLSKKLQGTGRDPDSQTTTLPTAPLQEDGEGPALTWKARTLNLTLLNLSPGWPSLQKDEDYTGL